jgi:hypothetical protein
LMGLSGTVEHTDGMVPPSPALVPMHQPGEASWAYLCLDKSDAKGWG